MTNGTYQPIYQQYQQPTYQSPQYYQQTQYQPTYPQYQQPQKTNKPLLLAILIGTGVVIYFLTKSSNSTATATSSSSSTISSTLPGLSTLTTSTTSIGLTCTSRGIFKNSENCNIGTIIENPTNTFKMDFGPLAESTWFRIRLCNLMNTNCTFILNVPTGMNPQQWFPDNDARRNNMVFSYDKINWNKMTGHLNITVTPNTFTFGIIPTTNDTQIAFFYPYDNWLLDRFLNTYSTNSHITTQIIGTTYYGRNQRMVTITDPSIPDTNKKVIWIIYREDAGESVATGNAFGAIRYLLSSNTNNVRKNSIWKLCPIVSTDGVALGANRGIDNNGNGIYLTRQWTNSDESITPKEILNIKNQMRQWQTSGKPLHLSGRQHSTYFQSTRNIFGSSQSAFNTTAQTYLPNNTDFGMSNNWWPDNSGRFHDFVKTLYPNVVYFTTENIMVNMTTNTIEDFGVSVVKTIIDYLLLN